MLIGPYPVGLKLGKLESKEVETLVKKNFLIHTIKYGVNRSLSVGRPHESFVPIFMHPEDLSEYVIYWERERESLYKLLVSLGLK